MIITLARLFDGDEGGGDGAVFGEEDIIGADGAAGLGGLDDDAVLAEGGANGGVYGDDIGAEAEEQDVEPVGEVENGLQAGQGEIGGGADIPGAHAIGQA